MTPRSQPGAGLAARTWCHQAALDGIDLNLLVVLQALLEEGNVTRAGVRLGMPRPTVSSALARLRRHYRNELLVRGGNGCDLTPLARSLLPSVQESTRRIGRVFSPGQPPAGDRVFTISLSDYSMTVLGQPLLRRVQDLAPEAGIQLRFVTWEETEADRNLPGYDLLVRPPQLLPDDHPEVLLRDKIVYVGDPANPRLRDGRLTVGDLAALPHAAVRLPGPASDAAATALLQRGIRPNVVLATPGWLELPFLVAGTDMVAAVPERLARRLAAGAGVIVAEPPFGPVELAEAAWWHPLHPTDPGLTWLRSLVAEVAASLALSLPDARLLPDRQPRVRQHRPACSPRSARRPPPVAVSPRTRRPAKPRVTALPN